MMSATSPSKSSAVASDFTFVKVQRVSACPDAHAPSSNCVATRPGSVDQDRAADDCADGLGGSRAWRVVNVLTDNDAISDARLHEMRVKGRRGYCP